MYGRTFYDNVAHALSGFLPPALRGFEWQRSSRNLKLWYGSDECEHYEIQMVKTGSKKYDLGLEIGFHAEHKDIKANDDAVARIMKAEKNWRSKLGKEPELGPFIGYQVATWRRISEVWDRMTDDSGVAVDAAERLAAYIKTFEPIRATG